MNTETIPITRFRRQLTALCRAVRVGKKELIVTQYATPVFKVVRVTKSQSSVEVNFTHVRDRVSDFIDLLEINGVVTITHGNKKVACVKL